MLAEPKAVLWDFDGTMVDTEPLWAATERAILAEHSVVWDDAKMLAVHGQNAAITAQMIADDIGRPDLGEEVWHDLHARISGHLRAEGLPWMPGARDLLDEMAQAGVRCAVVTASVRMIVDAALERLPANVEFIVAGDDVANSKPDPEGYLLAMQRLGVRPDETLILEDSRPGTTAALASGAFVYAVASIAQLDDHPRLYRAAVGLDRVTWPDLAGVWRSIKDNA